MFDKYFGSALNESSRRQLTGFKYLYTHTHIYIHMHPKSEGLRDSLTWESPISFGLAVKNFSSS